MTSTLTGTAALVTGASSGIGAATGRTSIAGRAFGVNGFTEALRQEITERHAPVGDVEPGDVTTELGTHNSDQIQSDRGSRRPARQAGVGWSRSTPVRRPHGRRLRRAGR